MPTSTRREFAVQVGRVASGLALGQAMVPRAVSAGAGTFGLSIDITGLCALAHDRAGAQTEVILVDPASIGSGMPRHTPFLVANLRDVTNPPEESRPTAVTAVPSTAGGGVEQMGLWDLSDQQVLIRRAGGAEVASGLKLNLSEDDREAPLTHPKDIDDPEQWRDLRYVADMGKICGQSRISPELLSLGSSDESLGSIPVPQLVAGRVRLAGGVLEGAIPSVESSRGVEFAFPAVDGRPAFSQPLTDTVSWRLSADTLDSSNYLTIDLVPLRRNRSQEGRTIMVALHGRTRRFAISNLPTQNPQGMSHAGALHAVSDEQMAAFHFGVYYRLLRSEPPSWPLPELSPTPRGRKGAGLLRPSTCPPARFTRQ